MAQQADRYALFKVEDVSCLLQEMIYDRLEDFCSTNASWFIEDYINRFTSEQLARFRMMIIADDNRHHEDLLAIVALIEDELKERGHKYDE
jgi:hypothetical protein